MKERYPTWDRVSRNLITSQERVDGVADFMIMREGKKWFVKWRTSAGLAGPFKSAAAAMHSVEDSLPKGANDP